MREVSEKEKQEYRIPELHMGHYSQVYFPKNTEEAKEALRNSNKRNVTVIGRESHSDDEVLSITGFLNYLHDREGTYEIWYSLHGFNPGEKVLAMPLEANNLEALLVHRS